MINDFLKSIYKDSHLEKFSEMSNIYQDETGLPVNIWIDAAKEYITGRHAKRIKFQTNTCGSIGGQPTCPMMLDGKIPSRILKKNKIKSEFIDAVRNFVLNNQFALSKASDELIRDSEFKEIMIKTGVPASDEAKDELIRQTKILIKNKLDNNKFYGKDRENALAALCERPEIPYE